MNVKGILARKGTRVITIHPDRTLQEAATILTEHRIGSLVVVDNDGHLAGILSERDIVRQIAVGHSNALTRLVGTVMTHDLITGTPQDDLHAVANLMTERRFRHLPIMDRGALVGIISIGDVLKAQRDAYLGEVDTLETQILADED